MKQLRTIVKDLQELLTASQKTFDNLSDSGQESEYGERLAEKIECMEEALSALESCE